LSNYTQSTNFATKDALSPGDPLKIVRGTEINTEFANIAVAVATKFDTTALASPGPIGATTPAAINGTTGTFSGNVQMTSLNGGAVSLRNKIINGSFTVNQRGITTVTPASGDYTADRWAVGATVASKFSISISTAGSTGVAAGISGGVLTATTLVAYAVTASDTFTIQQRVEGLNIADLAWGTAAAKTVTLSFFAFSSLTGTFGGSIRNSTSTRSYPFSYSIPVASTFTKISVTITGDTGGAFTDWLTTTGIGLIVTFSLGTGATLSGTSGSWAATQYNSATGAVSVVGTLSATLSIANVQLEVGPVATPFEQRPIGMELALCQRYYAFYTAVGPQRSTAICNTYVNSPVVMRTTPSVFTYGTVTIEGTGVPAGQSTVTTGSNSYFFRFETTFTAAGAVGTPCSQSITASAEL